VKRIRIHKPRIAPEHPWREILPADPRDPDVVRAKALCWAHESLELGVQGRIARALEDIGDRLVTTAGDIYRTPRGAGSTAAVRRART
jgi:hypothetical protein